MKDAYYRHIIFTYKGKTYQHFKMWDFNRIEKVLSRLGATLEMGVTVETIIKGHKL